MDVAALIVAIVALLASIFSVGWQVFTWRQTRTPTIQGQGPGLVSVPPTR
jgi:hypothetical protein